MYELTEYSALFISDFLYYCQNKQQNQNKKIKKN